ncbi:SAM-dependent methyltransferase [Lachnospiraceae bacterium AM48-27BH]|nr:SAM-dependent methyltransferase [Lachnospiraceae bacterium AM48-27BH]
MERIKDFLDEQLGQIILSNSRRKEEVSKVRVRPLLLQGKLVFQVEEFRGKQAFHQNLMKDEAYEYLQNAMSDTFRQMELASAKGSAQILVSKNGKMTVKVKKNRPVKGQAKIQAPSTLLDHNRKKKYVLEEGKPIPFLQDLGVMTADGRIVHSRYDKFRQINRFLEFVQDILPKLPKGREINIIDFGCGKSYLTFAMYYYLKELNGFDIRVIGLDLKQDVIDHCNQLARKYGFEKLAFYHGDIASYEGVDQVDMVVTLHACDTATDYALAKAVRWNASVILSVPCCQHELNRQMKNDMLEPVLQYGLLKERMAALYTDGIRAEILENHGYRTQILEFIDMEHTPKNVLIRAVKEGKGKKNGKKLQEMMDFLHVENTLAKEIGIQM